MEVPDTKDNRDKCICPDCPSYPGCKGELLYCSIGRSCCEINAKGCFCPGCPVFTEYGLERIYFCDKEEEHGILMRKKRTSESKSFYDSVLEIKEIAQTGKSVVKSMGSLKKMPFTFDDIQFTPAQVMKIPLNREESVNVHVTIGPDSEKPMILSSPIIISGMSYGAVSKSVRLVIARASEKMKIGFNSGEGGIREDELKIASRFMIGQYATGRFGISDSVLKNVSAIEIRFGQGAYPGKGSYLPSDKITPEIARIRGLKIGEAAYSPAHHSDMRTPEEIADKVDQLRRITGGIPIGAKIGCGNIEDDIRVLVDSDVDFISIDGFGGGTGATDYCVRENVGIPLIAALPRARRFLDRYSQGKKITLIAGGGLRTSADFAKCLALGADAIYIGTAALIAINCEQYRICHTGLCPTGITTHDAGLEKQLNIEEGVRKLSNFIKVCTDEIAEFTRIVGKSDVSMLKTDDIVSLSKELAEIGGIRWLDGKIPGSNQNTLSEKIRMPLATSQKIKIPLAANNRPSDEPQPENTDLL